jgi:hypothetical protein
MAEMAGWNVVDAGSRSRNKEGRRGVMSLQKGIRGRWGL